ncbi:MAG: shikimate kinase [Verrucomicrobia bacterium]|nr:shikimate kinase [Verrucomicrobiota bacterium]MBI3870468.1 shikimate kinase [Verrucomicrobiota bacterium]
MHNLALIGFMGVGKTSTGHLVATGLGFEFVDTDALIEETVGKTIPQVFQEFGEPAFRDLEVQVGRLLESRRRVVIATGGGFVLNAENMQRLKRHALVVCLWASPEVIFERVRHQGHRPLLQGPDPLGQIRLLLLQRGAVYKQADVLVNTEQRTNREVASKIIHHFQSLCP